MRAGHPFDTPGLDDVRAEQRHALRLVPTSIFAEHSPTVVPDVAHIADVDRPLIETALRAEAKKLLADLASMLDGWQHHAHTEAVDHFYQQNRTRGEQMDAPRRTAFEDELNKARAAHQATDPVSPRVEDAPALRRLLFLLVWADGLTDYRDPRVPDGEPVTPARGDVTGSGRAPFQSSRSQAPVDDDATQLLAPEDLP